MKRKISGSKIIAFAFVVIDGIATIAVLGLCYMAIKEGFTGALPFLSALIGALQASTAIVLNAYFKKATKENTAGGIIYDKAMKDEAIKDEACQKDL